MSSLSSRFTIVLCGLSVCTLAFGQNASIEANLKGADGQPAKNAQVQIDSLDKKAKAIVVKTDASGHAAATKLEAGSYRVSAIVGGKVQSSQKVKAEANKPAVVAFKMPNASNAAVATGAKTKVVGHVRYVWVPGQTGSRFGGYWKEAGTADLVQDANGNPVETSDGQGMDNIAKQTRSSARSTSGAR